VRIRLNVSSECYTKLEKKLLAAGFVIDASDNTEYMYMDMDMIMDKDGNVLFGE